jgi:hypothetical protein
MEVHVFPVIMNNAEVAPARNELPNPLSPHLKQSLHLLAPFFQIAAIISGDDDVPVFAATTQPPAQGARVQFGNKRHSACHAVDNTGHAAPIFLKRLDLAWCAPLSLIDVRQ